jgi:hypothetical protein
MKIVTSYWKLALLTPLKPEREREKKEKWGG